MQLAISNIAWPSDLAEDAFALLAEAGVHGLEIAPGALFAGEPDVLNPSAEALRRTMNMIREAELIPVSMQSLLYGVKDAFLFGNEDQLTAFKLATRRAIDLANRLGIRNLVVGSPKNRIIPVGMDTEDAWLHAADVFRGLGEYAAPKGTVLAMEPNPTIYGTNFLNRMQETLDFVCQVEHPAVTVNFDVGSLIINNEFNNLDALLAETHERMSHVHISEPDLAPIQSDSGRLQPLFAALRVVDWSGFVSIEMRAVSPDPLDSVRVAVNSCLQALDEVQ